MRAFIDSGVERVVHLAKTMNIIGLDQHSHPVMQPLKALPFLRGHADRCKPGTGRRHFCKSYITAIPFGIYDVIEAIDNVESAAGAGDDYSTKKVLVADGLISILGASLGNPFMLVVYVGHPGWKSMGGRIGYAAASGLMILILAFLGIIPAILAIVPVAAVYPILLFIAMVIGAQAFRETPAKHAPAIILGILPHLFHWAGDLVKNALSAVGVKEITPEVEAQLAGANILIRGFEVLGEGAVLTGIVLSATAVYVIDGKLRAAALFISAGAVFSFFGLMHSRELGIMQSPTLVVTYLLVAGLLLMTHQTNKAKTPPLATEIGELEGTEPV